MAILNSKPKLSIILKTMPFLQEVIAHLMETLEAAAIPHEVLLFDSFKQGAVPLKKWEMLSIRPLGEFSCEQAARGDFTLYFPEHPHSGSILPQEILKLYHAMAADSEIDEVYGKVIFSKSQIINYPKWKFYLMHALHSPQLVMRRKERRKTIKQKQIAIDWVYTFICKRQGI
ncbi:MAG: hypothetical protein HQK50_04790 [Oligoflexia bacterium]|nr:hypothetical protein [Oligoflexia bacterium]MBF0364863.1 hypothetical protein [Oligoflexia bacterium]